MKHEIILVFLVISLIGVSISLGYVANSEINSLLIKISNKEIESPEQCKNLSMKDTAHCLNRYIKSIHKYKKRPDIENPSLQELITEGGDCKNWAELYVGYIDDLGFNARTTTFNTGNRTAHAFAIISDETGYCNLDQSIINCVMLD